MKDIFLAKLILEHGSELLSYLKLRAYCCVNNTDILSLSDLKSLNIKSKDIQVLQESGFLTVVNESLCFKDSQGKWLGYPKTNERDYVIDNDYYIPRVLQHVCDIIGPPPDWLKHPGRYLKQYLRVKKLYTETEIITLAKKFAQHQKGLELGVFLSEKGLKTIKAMDVAPKVTDVADKDNYHDASF